jgi:hypothetical protein
MPKIVNPRIPREKLAARFITPNQYAELKNVSRASVYNGMARGLIPFDCSDGVRRIPLRVIDDQERAAIARATALAAVE